MMLTEKMRYTHSQHNMPHMHAHTAHTHIVSLYMQLKQLLSNELPYEEDWEDGSINNSILESVDDSSTVHSDNTSPAPSINTEALNKVCSIRKIYLRQHQVGTANFYFL